MSILDSPDAASVVSTDDIRHFEEQVVVYEQDIAAVLAEIEKLREEEEDNAKLFSSEIDKFIDDIRKCRQEIQDEIVHTGDVVQRDRDGMLQSCDEELEVIKEKLEVMKEMHDERVHEIIEGYAVVSVSNVPWHERIQNKLMKWFTLGVSTVISPQPVLSLATRYLRDASCNCWKKRERVTVSS